MAQLDDFSKIYHGGKSIAKVYGGELVDLDSKDISTNNQAIEVIASTTLAGTSVSRLFDGIKNNDTNRWVSTGNDTNPKLTITLDKLYTISQIIIHNGYNSGTNNFVQDVEIIIDGISQGTFVGNKTPIDINFVNEPIGKVIELKFPAGYNRIYEIEIYGKEHLNLIWEYIPMEYNPFELGVEYRLNNVSYLDPPQNTNRVYSIYLPVPSGATRINFKNVGSSDVDMNVDFFDATKTNLNLHSVEKWVWLTPNNSKYYTLTNAVKYIRLYQYSANSIYNTQIKFT